MLNRAVQHFLEDVAWPEDLDYLLIDMPPGTGDVQMGLARMLPRAEMIVVTTPALARPEGGRPGRHHGPQELPPGAGVIENMSAFTCDHGDVLPAVRIGRRRGPRRRGRRPAARSHPARAAVSAGGDDGRPVVLGDGAAAAAFGAILDRLVDDLAPPVDMAGCSARMLEAAVAALDADSATTP